MKLFKAFADTGFHTSIITTFGVDFDAYEAIALARLREAGCRNNILIADGRMLAHSMNDEARRPRLAGRSYSVVGAQPKGVFHPKLILQLGKSKGRLLIASANMTSPGLAGNLEVVGCINSDEDDRSANPLLQAALAFLKGFIEAGSVPASQLAWAAQRTTWLPNTSPGEVLVELGDAGQAAFLASNDSEGIASRFIGLVGGAKVKRLIVVSPYWDVDLSALKYLKKALAPKETAVLIQKSASLFPVQSWPGEKSSTVLNADKIDGAARTRFAHAKVVIAETSSADLVLYGSANCTTAALGSEAAPAINEEACLCRVLGPGEAVQLLGMELAFSESSALDLSELKYEPAADIPMRELEAHLPGRFELNGTLLQWWPPKGIDVSAARLQLYDENSSPLPASLVRRGESDSPVSFDCKTTGSPCFVKVTAPKFESSLGIVVVDDAIRVAQRPAATGAAKDRIAMLFDEEAFEGLWLIDVIQKLHEAERKVHNAGNAKAAKTAKPSPAPSGSDPVTYEQFIAKRRTQQHAGVGGSHLASSNQESVRSFLNFLLGRNDAHRLQVEDESRTPDFSLGDETADAEEAIESDDRFDTTKQFSDEDKLRRDAIILKRRQEFLKDTQASIVKHVDSYIKGTRHEASERLLTVVDLLKLRVLLLIVLASGSKQVHLFSKDLSSQSYRREVLPALGDHSWSRLTLRLLNLFFRDHAGPCINRVTLGDVSTNELPEDVFDCWATCYWALAATRVFVNSYGALAKRGTLDEALARSMIEGIGLSPKEAMSEAVRILFASHDARYGDRLGVSPGAAWEEHVQLVSARHTTTREG